MIRKIYAATISIIALPVLYLILQMVFSILGSIFVHSVGIVDIQPTDIKGVSATNPEDSSKLEITIGIAKILSFIVAAIIAFASFQNIVGRGPRKNEESN
ncbi:MAG: hypothetical protein GW778_03540 [Alphaproteobacteria bacterium]|nr:hypothetical protein [Alphaproteobacteria bacterium]